MKSLAKFINGFKNAYIFKKKFFICQNSSIIFTVINILYKQGLINNFIINPKNPETFIIFLKYLDGVPVLKEFKLISKPTKRIYINSKEFCHKFSKEGLFLISTSQYGIILTNSTSKVFPVSGEVLAKLII